MGLALSLVASGWMISRFKNYEGKALGIMVD
jgi:hypothetical protein